VPPFDPLTSVIRRFAPWGSDEAFFAPRSPSNTHHDSKLTKDPGGVKTVFAPFYRGKTLLRQRNTPLVGI